MYDKNIDKYFIDLRRSGLGLVEVTKEIHDVFYKMERRERYLIERDQAHGLLYYDEWSQDRMNGVDFIIDKNISPEEAIMQKMLPSIWEQVAKVEDKYHICYFVSIGKKDKEIAEIVGISRSGINKIKRKLFKKLRELMETENTI